MAALSVHKALHGNKCFSHSEHLLALRGCACSLVRPVALFPLAIDDPGSAVAGGRAAQSFII
jgi:hypothetical protein